MDATLLEELATGQTPSFLPLTVDQVHRMLEAGILPEGEPFELIDGILVHKDRAESGDNRMSHSRRHALTVIRIGEALVPLRQMGCHCQMQLPVTLSAISEPEPDVAVVRGGAEEYASAHPGAGDLLAVVEVAASSLGYDRSTKQRIYAGAGIPQYWIVNLRDGAIEVYSDVAPLERRYARRRDYHPGESVRLDLPEGTGLSVAVSTILMSP